MKNLNFLVAISGVLLIATYSCAPIYKCGEIVPDKKPRGKRLSAVVEERDQLCVNLENKEAENESLSSQLKESEQLLNALNNDFDNLQNRFNKLIDDNLSQEEQFNATLKQKSEELNNKEKLLADRERALKEMQEIIARQDSITNRLNDIVRNALLGFNADELSVEIKNGKVYVSMSDKLLFKSGSANVESKGREAIKMLADVLTKNPDIDVLVEGHTDNVPIRTAQFRDNWDLSVVRATSIVRMLTDEHKIAPTRITASGKGEFMPRDSNETSEGRARNRRTEIILSPKLDELMKMLNMN